MRTVAWAGAGATVWLVSALFSEPAAQPGRSVNAAAPAAFSFSTFLGGGDWDEVTAIALDSAGYIYLTGQTASANFPGRVAGQSGNRDIFIAKLDPGATRLIYSTVLGGQQTERAKAIAVDAAGNAYVTGYTNSGDFPTTAGAYQRIAGGMEDAFVVKLNSGGSLVYSTYLGGSDRDFAAAIAIDSSGNAYIAGYTHSMNFPATAGAFQAVYAGGFWDAFAAKINPSGTALVYSTLLGGIAGDLASAIAVDAAGNAYLAGQTDSTNFPLNRAAQAINHGGMDVFVAELNTSGSALLFSTYLGGSSSDIANALAIDAFQNVYIAGATASVDFPVSSAAYQAVHAGGVYDAFAAKLNLTSAAVVFSTLLGGSAIDQATALAIDNAGDLWLAGSTASMNFPLVRAPQSQNAGGTDAFVALLNATGDRLVYSTYAGGAQDDGAAAIAMDNKGAVFAAGITNSGGFPITSGVLQTAEMGSYDGFVFKLQTGACPYTVNPATLTVAPEGASGSVSVTIPAGCAAASADSDVSWASVSMAGNTANWSVNANPSSAARAGALNVAGQTVAITQAGASCSYGVDPLTIHAGAAGASGTLAIAPSPTDCPAATASSNIAWGSIAVSGTSASWSVIANPSSKARGGSFTVGGRSVVVSQSGAACSYSLSAYSLNLGAAAGSGTIAITPSPPDCAAPAASSDAAWASITATATKAAWTVDANGAARSRSGNFVVGGQSVAVMQAAAGTAGILSLGRSSLNFATSAGWITGPQTVPILFLSGPAGEWTASSNQPNISAAPAAGVGNATLLITAAAGPSGTVTVTSSGAPNSPQQVQVKVAAAAGALTGSFDTPMNGVGGITGAVAVTGWTLDGVEVMKVDLWREPWSGEGVNLVYLGDAVFVAGARPDVESNNPGAPLNYRAGWGYMLLTNLLPGGGNGTYKLHAIAHNKAGAALDLGTHAIGVENAHASKPFGTIDTPAQGATIYGSAYINFGWALTQNPYAIPKNGSTITVYLDGAPMGHPTYDQYRSDIATLFPGLANSLGAVGFYAFDTTALANGIHTISWTVYDNQGQGEGIGSRYFNVLNGGSGFAISGAQREQAARPMDARIRPVEMEELGRLELEVGATEGYSLIGGERRPLPVGSTLRDGVFYWQAGPGFLGEHELVFERPGMESLTMRVKIGPKTFR